jgi:hypothetical protein
MDNNNISCKSVGKTGKVMQTLALEMGEERKKQSFDPDEKAKELLSRLDEFHGLKGKFINKCIEIAGEPALRELVEALDAAARKRGHKQAGEKNNK